ncbi:hypothetical protein BVC80_1787g197 [Macleaya cordata]|uniref:Uncharacterized protein n=1 Tax=Macleaya cordata TaxID=56857 RepID=A0A200QUG7_MACCD|nr:hypothetical protein BVC80_1787g197 [Macleaya cordata]
MRIRNSSILFTFLIILVVIQLPSFSYSYRPLNGKEPRLKIEYLARFSSRLSAVSPSPDSSKNDIDPIYGVSKRLVPGGPNPLHN